MKQKDVSSFCPASTVWLILKNAVPNDACDVLDISVLRTIIIF